VDTIKRAVVFIHAAGPSGAVEENKALGTGFLVEVPLKSRPEVGYALLVTARHILDPAWANCTSINPSRVYLRLNKKVYRPDSDPTGIGYQPVDTIVNGIRVRHKHEDNHIDGAVLRRTRQWMSNYDTLGIRIRDFPTDDEVSGLAEGFEVVSAGLLPGRSGR
jgi:hypothetical protein